MTYVSGIMTAATMAVLTAVASQSAFAADKVRVRGTIERMDGSDMTIKSADAKELMVMLQPGTTILGVKNASAGDIKPGDFVGIGSQPTASGINGAVQVVIFPASMKGTGEGDRAWDVRPNGSMTNATVADAVTDVNGQTVTLAYKGGERKINIPGGTRIVALMPATKDNLKPGVEISVQGVSADQGMVSADRISVGLEGAAPM